VSAAMGQIILEYDSSVPLASSIRSAIDKEIRMLEAGLEISEQALMDFEKRYKMVSEDFFEKMEKGEMGDSLDFIKWVGELFLKTREKLEALKGLRIFS
jgi:hypothetical protein